MKMKKFLALVLSMCMIFSMSAVAFAEGDGTEESPEVLTALTGDTVSLEGGTTSTYTYTYEVPSDVEGTIMYNFSIDEVTEDVYYYVTVYNDTTGESAQMIFSAYYDVDAVSIKAKAGDSIRVKASNLSMYDEESGSYVYNAVNIKWLCTSTAVGTADSPEAIDTMYQWGSYAWSGNTTVATDGTAYYYSYQVEKTGTLYLYIDEYSSLDYYYNMGWDPDDASIPNTLAELAAEIVITNDTDSVKYSDGTESLTVATNYGSDTYNVIQMEVTEGDEITIAVSSEAEGYESVDIYFGTMILEPYGSQGNPVGIANNNQTVTIPAGATYYVSVTSYTLCQYPVSITGGDAVVYDITGTELEGQSDIVIEEYYDMATYTSYYMLQVKNAGGEDVTYTFTFTLPEGLEANPKTLEGSDSDNHTFNDDWSGYCYYTWTAAQDGILAFNVTTDVEGANWSYSADNKTSGYEGPFVYSSDEPVEHIVMEVSEGDVISMYVYAYKYGDNGKETVVATTTTTFTASNGGVVDPEVVSGIVSDIRDGYNAGDYDEGGSVTIDMCDDEGNTVATVIPAEILAMIIEAADEGVVIDLEFTMDGYTWYISNVESSLPVDLEVVFGDIDTLESIITAKADGNKYVTFSIAHDGELGFDAQLEFKVSTDYAGKTAALYVDNDGTLELVGEKCTVATDGTVKYAMDHASDYVLVIEGTKSTSNTPDPVDPDNTTNPDDTADMAPIAMALVVAAVAAVVALKKKETVED